MVKLGIANTRMKDFHDLHSLSKMFHFDGQILAEAIRATFLKRGTKFPSEETPLAFTPGFYEDQMKVKQSNAFCNKNKSYLEQTELKDIVADLASTDPGYVSNFPEIHCILAQFWRS